MRKISCLILALLALASIAFCYRQEKICDKLFISFLKKKFTEPIEILYLGTYDGTLYKVTSYDENRIWFNMDTLVKKLDKHGHDMTDVAFIVHNHPPNTTREFSISDIQSWWEFKHIGFTGNFYLYIQGTNLVYELREDKECK